MTVVDIGAGASGFQFVLGGLGLKVISVDPLLQEDKDLNWVFTECEFERLNRAFRSNIQFFRAFLQDAKLSPESVDRVFAISVLEHVPQPAVEQIMQEAARILKPGGMLVATIDLFTDCAPFTGKLENHWGTNISVASAIAVSGMDLFQGRRDELCGFPEFRPECVTARDDVLRVNDAMTQCDVMTQCVVLRKSALPARSLGNAA